ncbi:MAG TPA: winged helix-turn-helix transcriptional regulator [Dehalococcoidia bacterium]|nr:winged helix-turn-helix transcriptional regulator [Dehalococcoidia bacterium]
MSEWTFLTNHGLVLSFVARHPRMTALEIADAIGITERSTRKIIADLTEAGYIYIKKEGRRNRYRINPDISLRHPAHRETAVGDFLKALGWKGRSRATSPKSSFTGDPT